MNLYEEYALVKAKMTELENQEDALRVKILEQMVEKGEEKVETAMGSFKKATLKKWVYPEEVLEKEEEYLVSSGEELTKTEIGKLRRDLAKNKDLLILFREYEGELASSHRFDFDDMINSVKIGRAHV